MNSESETKIRAIIVDDEPHARQGMERALSDFSDLVIVGI